MMTPTMTPMTRRAYKNISRNVLETLLVSTVNIFEMINIDYFLMPISSVSIDDEGEEYDGEFMP